MYTRILVRAAPTNSSGGLGYEHPVVLAWACYSLVGMGMALAGLVLVLLVPQAQGSGLPPLIAFCMARCNRYSAAPLGSAFAGLPTIEEEKLPPRKANL